MKDEKTNTDSPLMPDGPEGRAGRVPFHRCMAKASHGHTCTYVFEEGSILAMVEAFRSKALKEVP